MQMVVLEELAPQQLKAGVKQLTSGQSSAAHCKSVKRAFDTSTTSVETIADFDVFDTPSEVLDGSVCLSGGEDSLLLLLAPRWGETADKHSPPCCAPSTR